MMVIAETEITDFSRREFGRKVGVSEHTIARRIREGSIASYRVGRQVRIPYSEWLRVQREGVPLPVRDSA